MNSQQGIAPFIFIIIGAVILSVGAGVFVFLGSPEPISNIIEERQEDGQEVKEPEEIELALPGDGKVSLPEDLIKLPEKAVTQKKVVEAVREDIQQSLSLPVFTHHIIVLSDYESLTPPGSISLNTFAEHGYLKLKDGVKRSPIYAPIDVEIRGIAYYSYSDQYVPEVTNSYDLFVFVNKDVDLFLGGIAELVPKLKAVAPQEPQETSVGNEMTPISVKAGELLGYVEGWDFGAYDITNRNIVANPQRHLSKWDDFPGKYVTGVCPYNYYPDDMKQEYLDLMDGKKCPNASRDVPGTAAGYWFGNETFHVVEDDDFYVSGESLRFVISGREDNSVGWAGFGSGTDRVGIGASPVDPADFQVGDSFCYKNDLDWIDTGKNYLFVKLLSGAELGLFYGEGICPSSFPEEGYKIYVR